MENNENRQGSPLQGIFYEYFPNIKPYLRRGNKAKKQKCTIILRYIKTHVKYMKLNDKDKERYDFPLCQTYKSTVVWN